MNHLRFIAEALWLPALILIGWEISSVRSWLNPFFFPPPSRIVVAGWEMAKEGEVTRELQATLGRYGLGVLVGATAGLAAGIVMGSGQFARRSMEVIVASLYATPKITLLPLVMLIFGIGDLSKVILVAVVSFIYLSRQTTDAIRGLDKSYVEMARNYRASWGSVVRYVYVPGALPQIFTGFRIALTRSLVTAISLEIVSSRDGLGSLIWMAWQTMATERLYVGIFLAALVGISIHFSLAWLEKYFIRWREG